MNKTIKLILLSLLTILVLTTAVNAAEATARLSGSSETIAPGDTFEVILSAECEDGINGLVTTINYDETKLEKVSLETTDTSKWANIGGENIDVINLSENSITRDDIVKVTFKLKEDVDDGEEIRIYTGIIELDTDEETNSTRTIAPAEYTFTVGREDSGDQTGGEELTLTKIDITKDPNKTSYKVGEQVDLTGIEVTATYSDGTTKVITNYLYTPNGKLTEEDKTITISYTENGVTKTVEKSIEVVADGQDDKKDDKKDEQVNNVVQQGNNAGQKNVIKVDSTVSDKDYPNAGAEKVILPIVLVVIILVGSYIGYRKYKEI